MLDTHVKNIHENKNAISQICDICGLTVRYSIDKHKTAIHGVNKVPKVQCDTCGAW